MGREAQVGTKKEEFRDDGNSAETWTLAEDSRPQG